MYILLDWPECGGVHELERHLISLYLVTLICPSFQVLETNYKKIQNDNYFTIF